MELIIQARNLELSDHLRDHIDRKIGRLSRYLPNLREARVELYAEATKDVGDRHIVEVTLNADGTFLRGEESAGDIFSSIDAVADTLQRQIERYKGRAWYLRRRQEALRKQAQMRDAEALEQALADEEAPPLSPVVRRKQFQLMPMDEQEAIEQMELLGHDFFVFYNAESGRINVVYRRRGGDYGLLDPQ